MFQVVTIMILPNKTIYLQDINQHKMNTIKNKDTLYIQIILNNFRFILSCYEKCKGIYYYYF